jgi:hypothetical protein
MMNRTSGIPSFGNIRPTPEIRQRPPVLELITQPNGEAEQTIHANMRTENALLVILTNPKEHRIRCQAPGCIRTVYEKIHVVRLDGAITVYGSACYLKHFKGQAWAAREPAYRTVGGRALTDEERALLDSNTELLLKRLAAEHDANVATEAQRLAQSLKAQQQTVSESYDQVNGSTLGKQHFRLQPVDDYQYETFDEDRAAPELRDFILAKKHGKTRAQLLRERGIHAGHPDFYSFSLLLAKAGFDF